MVGMFASVLLCATGCHTIEAVRALSEPSPISELRMRSGDSVPRSLRWRADYGYSSYPDNMWVGLFGRTVRHQGAWDISDRTICFRSRTGMKALSPGVEELVLEIPAWEWGATPTAEELASLPLRCNYFLRVERDDPRSGSYATGARLIPLDQGEAEIPLPLPVERPASDPKRWGWLIAAPPLDVVTIALGVPALILISLPNEAPVGVLAP
jgi:hypothetical protein